MVSSIGVAIVASSFSPPLLQRTPPRSASRVHAYHVGAASTSSMASGDASDRLPSRCVGGSLVALMVWFDAVTRCSFSRSTTSHCSIEFERSLAPSRTLDCALRHERCRAQLFHQLRDSPQRVGEITTRSPATDTARSLTRRDASATALVRNVLAVGSRVETPRGSLCELHAGFAFVRHFAKPSRLTATDRTPSEYETAAGFRRACAHAPPRPLRYRRPDHRALVRRAAFLPRTTVRPRAALSAKVAATSPDRPPSPT